MQRKELLLLREKLKQSRKDEETSIPNFLRKTHDILEKEEHKDIVSWSDDGKALVIKDPTVFSEKVLPLYFKHSNLASFVRQLNMYNFKKRKTQQYENTFVHDMFRRGEKHLLCHIKRKGADSANALAKARPKPEEVNEEESDLLQENQTLMQVQKTMSEKIQSLEKKLNDTMRLNELLLMQIQILTSSDGNGSAGPSFENFLTDISRKLTQNSTFSTASSLLATEDILPQFLRNDNFAKLMNWSPVTNLGNNLVPQEIKVDNVTLSVNAEKGKVNYFENLLNLVSKINGADTKK